MFDDCHSLPQSASVFYGDGARACTHVLRYEDLYNQSHKLRDAYGTDLMGGRTFDCLANNLANQSNHSKLRDYVPLGAPRLRVDDIPRDIRQKIEAAYAPENEKLYAYLAATRGPAEEPPFPRFERMPCVVRAREHGGRE